MSRTIPKQANRAATSLPGRSSPSATTGPQWPLPIYTVAPKTASLNRSSPTWPRTSEAGAFDDLVIVAPPVALGEMRKAANGQLAKKIVATLDKDLTAHTVPDITAAVAKALEG